MEINKILFEQLAGTKGINNPFEDFDVNNDGIINENDATTNLEFAAKIKSLLNSDDKEPELVFDNETDAYILVSQLSDSELSSKIAELEAQYNFDDWGELNAKNWDETLVNESIENMYKELLEEKIKRNSAQHATCSDKERATKWANGAWYYGMMELGLSELEYLVSQKVHLNGRGVHLNYTSIKNEANWENRLREVVKAANVILWAGFNIEEEINKVKNSTDNPQDKIEDKLKNTYDYVVNYMMGACCMDVKKIPVSEYLRGMSDYNGDGQIDFCDLNLIPDEIDFDGDGCINNEEKRFLKEVKYNMYSFIDRMTKASLHSSEFRENGYLESGLTVTIDQIIARNEFLAKNPSLIALQEDFDNLYTTVFDVFDLGKETVKLQEKYDTVSVFSPIPNCGIPLRNSAYMDFITKNGREPSEVEFKQYIQEYYYKHNNIVSLYTSYIDDKSLSKADLEDILARINAVNIAELSQELSEIKEAIKCRLENYKA